LTETYFGLLRHGQTDWNINFLLQGVTDIPMNDTGRQQIRLAAQAIRKDEWDIVLTSPLSRARESASILNEVVGFEQIIEDELLIERSFGEAEGLSHEQWKARYSDLDEIPGGESRTELAKRSMLLLDSVTKRFSGKRVLAVSHGALIRALISHASNNELPKAGERLGNASLNVVAHSSGSWKMVDYQLDPLLP
jgi:uncharacterized phosphatase